MCCIGKTMLMNLECCNVKTIYTKLGLLINLFQVGLLTLDGHLVPVDRFSSLLVSQTCSFLFCKIKSLF